MGCWWPCCNNMQIVTGGIKSVGVDTTYGYTKGGNFVLSVDHGATVAGVAIGGSHFYTNGTRTSSITTRKYDLSGNQIWSYDHGQNGRGIAVDQSGNVYLNGIRSGGVTTRKLNSSGSVVWSYDYAASASGSQARGICVDQSGNVYIAGDSTGAANNRQVEKVNSSGTLVWGVDDLNPINFTGAIAVDLSGNVYVGTDTTLSPNFYVLHKLNSSGVVVWQKSVSTTVNPNYRCSGIAIGPTGNVYAIFNAAADPTTPAVRAYDSGGSVLWSKYNGEVVSAIEVDGDENIYLTRPSGLFQKITKLDSSGNEIWNTGPEVIANASVIDVLPGRQGAFG